MITPTIFENSPSLHRAAADYCLKAFQSTVKEQEYFHIALSGGTTPKHLFKLLANEPYSQTFDWSKVKIYFGDERFVAHTHDDSNFRMAKQTLLDHINIPKENIFSVATELESASAAAENYQNILTQNLPKDSNNNLNFDLVLLGLGPDGHTASLFPGTKILQQYNKYCDAVFVEKFDSWRISITFPVINSAKRILLLSEGEGKAEIIHELVNAQSSDEKYPVQMIENHYEIQWYIDQAAAQRL